MIIADTGFWVALGNDKDELVPVTKLAAFSWILLYNIASPVTESYQYVFRKY
jgi:hypothetical protein